MFTQSYPLLLLLLFVITYSQFYIHSSKHEFVRSEGDHRRLNLTAPSVELGMETSEGRNGVRGEV